jgi:hypothetical protein
MEEGITPATEKEFQNRISRLCEDLNLPNV